MIGSFIVASRLFSSFLRRTLSFFVRVFCFKPFYQYHLNLSIFILRLFWFHIYRICWFCFHSVILRLLNRFCIRKKLEQQQNIKIYWSVHLSSKSHISFLGPHCCRWLSCLLFFSININIVPRSDTGRFFSYF